VSARPRERARWVSIAVLVLAACAVAPNRVLATTVARNASTHRLTAAGVRASQVSSSSVDVSFPVVTADPLSANGFSSPSCTTAPLFAQISVTARRDCEVSGVAVAPVPLSNYAFDTNISSGLDASFGDDVDTIVQELLLTPVWTALVWLIHVSVVALEWCYSIDLLAPSTLGPVSGALSGAERIFTTPWLGLALALAGIAFVWHGVVRRRVTETLGQAALMAVMMSVGLWIIADPAGTVGALAQLADEAALGTVAVTAAGSPRQPVASLDDALGAVFDTAITGPWCYLEFGDVDWCRDPSQLDPRLEATGQRLERLYRAAATCHGGAPGLVQCAPGGSAEQKAFTEIVLALSAARTNGGLFLALPANGLARNALAGETALPSLYQTLCGGSDATNCTAGTAPQAEFRSGQGTWARAGGLLLIAIGVGGMLAMLGFIALRLLGAALAVLVYLLLAPIAVLAPAFGDSGRDTFRHWLTRLVGAALAKLVYSVLLGVTLLVVRLLTSIDALGWWTEWLLISVFWWLAFEHRHRALAFVIHERDEHASRVPIAVRVRHGTGTLGSIRRTGRSVGRAAPVGVTAAHDVWRQLRDYPPGPRNGPPAASTPGGIGRARTGLAMQVERSLAIDRASATVSADRAQASGEEIVRLRARRSRLMREESVASRAGASRRAVSLALRRRDVDMELAARRREQPAGRATDRPGWFRGRYDSRERSLREQVLNREALAGGERGLRSARNYAAAAGLAGLTAAAYEVQPASDRRRARLEIDRQLDQRRQWLLETGGGRRTGIRMPGTGLRGSHEDGHRPTAIGRRERQFFSHVR